MGEVGHTGMGGRTRIKSRGALVILISNGMGPPSCMVGCVQSTKLYQGYDIHHDVKIVSQMNFMSMMNSLIVALWPFPEPGRQQA